MQPHVSASQISTFQRCPRRWYLAKVARIQVPSEASPHTARGSAVHYALEHYALAGELPTSSVPRYLSTAEAWPAERVWNGKTYNNPTKAELGAQAISIANAMLCYAERLDKDSVEVHFRLPVGEGLPDVLGYIDVYEPDKALITDWKVRSNHRRNALRADTDTCSDCGYIVQGCRCPDPKRLAEDVQMNIYARKLLSQRPYLDAATVRHIYASSSGAPAPFEVRQQIPRSANALFWDRTVALIRAMDRVSRMAETDVPRLVDACNDYGGCAYRAHCYQQPFGSFLEDPVIREDVLAEMMQGTGFPVNPAIDPFLAIHDLAPAALDALCDQFRQQMGTDLRRKEPSIQIPALLTYMRQWAFDAFAKGWYEHVARLFPAVAPPPPPLPKADAPPSMGQPPRSPSEKSYRAQLTDFLKLAGVKGLRALIAADRQDVLTPLYAEIRNKVIANVKPPVGQTELFAAFKGEFEARQTPASMFATIFSGQNMSQGEPKWVPTFLMFSPEASRIRPAEADPVQFEWLCQQGALAEHPQGNAWYVTDTFRKEWEKHTALERAAQTLAQDKIAQAIESGALTESDLYDTGPLPLDTTAAVIEPLQGSRADRPDVRGIVHSIQGLLDQLARALA